MRRCYPGVRQWHGVVHVGSSEDEESVGCRDVGLLDEDAVR